MRVPRRVQASPEWLEVNISTIINGSTASFLVLKIRFFLYSYRTVKLQAWKLALLWLTQSPKTTDLVITDLKKQFYLKIKRQQKVAVFS